MPGTSEEIVRLATAPGGIPNGIVWADGTQATAEEIFDLVALREYAIRRIDRVRMIGAPQQRAMELLMSFLTDSQQRQLRRCRYFVATGSDGGVYRFNPRLGATAQVTRHGKRWFVKKIFCLHDDQANPREAMPPADLSLAHLLLLRSDEAEFHRLANVRDARDQLWNGDYQRRIREARRERELEPTL